MADITEANPTVAPPKKRSLFKKAAWQTAAKPEDKERDMFSHSNTFNDIIADEARRKREAKQKVQATKKRKPEEGAASKRRKVSTDVDELRLPGSGSGSSARASQTGRTGRSRTPLSPISKPDPNSLSARYDTLTKPSASFSSLSHKASDTVYLGDTDSEDDSLYSKPPPRQAPGISLPRIPSKPALSEDFEEDEDPAIAALIARARANAAKESQPAASREIDAAASKSAVVQLLITSEIPGSIQMLIKIKIDTKIDKPYEAWCARQGFPKEVKDNVFLTWKKKHIYNSTTIARLGVSIDPSGFITVEGDSQIYDENNLPKIHLEAWTEELFEDWLRGKAEEGAAKRKAADAPQEIEDEEPVVSPVVEVRKIRLYLKAKGKQDFRICVNPDTTFGHLTAAFKQKMDIPKDCPITLMFDGDRLKPLDTIADVDIEDEDSIEVHFK
ncbi:hypothetical protein K505DRAFT_304698 [Melanomma pulvis-pyrius CBS 109.77]|uniref:Ubiquitin-like domain-containing protein n=1 Tax=Melanomma pulvis-pyrius CBS 109.77 TaxID=1314802 RepID=A0A6A6XBU9_9PLEO|nr:hypothetical protein K505DRAFT_304698 [Melanomma pulvis-pyrius CBS 109.77]